MILALLVACGGGRIHPTDEHQPESPHWSSIEGSLDASYTVGGFAVCDATVSFTGVPYAGECDGCEFAFEIDPVLERDDGTVACPWIPAFTLYHTAPFWDGPTILGFVDHNNGVPDVLMLGGTENYDGKSYTYVEDFEDGDYVSVAIDGAELAWHFGYDSYFDYSRYSYYLNPCTAQYYQGDPQGPFGGATTFTGTLPCDGGKVDVFDMQGKDGSTLHLTLDDAVGGPSSMPTLAVWGPRSCVEGVAEGNYECASGKFHCPAMTLETTAGTYRVVVYDRGCEGSGESVDYRLDVDAPWDVELTPVYDDLPNEGKAHLEALGTATLME